MAIINQIEPLNLNPVLAVLYRIEYEFSSNKNDVLSSFDEEIRQVDGDIETVDQSFNEVKRGARIRTNQLVELGASTSGCSVADKNKRTENILDSLDDRKSELEIRREGLKNEREENKRFYDTILQTIKDILQTLIQLLIRLLEIIGNAISSIETAITTLASLPLGAGLGAVASLGFVMDLLQTKIYEPVSDTVSQQEVYEQNSPSVE